MPTHKSESGGIPHSTPLSLNELTEYASGSVVSRTLVKKETGNLTTFAFDEGQGLSEHSAPYDAYAAVVDGVGEFTIGGKTVQVETGQVVLMPADIPHAVQARHPFKMLLIMLRG